MSHRIAEREGGFTVIEILAALTIFAIITLGVTPLMIASIRSATLSRSYTKGKNLATEAMERVRGLPYFVSVGSVTPVAESSPRSDLLDLYFPNMTAAGSSGFQSATNSFVTTCSPSSSSPAASGAKACPANIPPDHTLRYEATFVAPDTAGTSFTTVVPTGYNWNSTDTEVAPSALLRMVITATWAYGGGTRSSTLTSIIGERALAKDKLRGVAQIDYIVQGLTGYEDSSGRVSNVVAVAGSTTSRVESRTVTAADQSTEVGRLTLTREEFGGAPAVVLGDQFGAAESLHAPPNAFPAPDVGPVSSDVMTHPDIAGQDVADLGPTRVHSPGVQVVSDLPEATGEAEFMTSSEPALQLFNNPGPLGSTLLKLTDDPMLTVGRVSSVELSGTSHAYATALNPTSDRKVEATATADFAELRMLPTDFITASEGSVIVITDFSASITCSSTATAGTEVADGSWEATLWFWKDADPSDGNAVGSYIPVPLGGIVGGLGIDPLDDLKATNPLVYDHSDPAQDVYLFTVPGQLGYFDDISSIVDVNASSDGTGRETHVELEGAVHLVSTRVNLNVPSSKITATVGAMSCEAVDKRGL